MLNRTVKLSFKVEHVIIYTSFDWVKTVTCSILNESLNLGANQSLLNFPFNKANLIEISPVALISDERQEGKKKKKKKK